MAKKDRLSELREEARKEAAKQRNLVTKIPKSTLKGEVKGDIVVEDYSAAVGFKMANWNSLKNHPLPTDIISRFDTPMSIKIGFEDYLRWVKMNPFKTTKPITAGQAAGTIMEIETPRPLTMFMFLSHIKMPKKVWDKKKEDENFCDLCELIENTINGNLIDGALVGVYDAKLAAKINKIGEEITINNNQALKVEISLNGESLPDKFILDDIQDAELIEND